MTEAVPQRNSTLAPVPRRGLPGGDERGCGMISKVRNVSKKPGPVQVFLRDFEIGAEGRMYLQPRGTTSGLCQLLRENVNLPCIVRVLCVSKL